MCLASPHLCAWRRLHGPLLPAEEEEMSLAVLVVVTAGDRQGRVAVDVGGVDVGSCDDERVNEGRDGPRSAGQEVAKLRCEVAKKRSYEQKGEVVNKKAKL